MTKDNQETRLANSFCNYKKSLKELEELVALSKEKELDKFYKAGLVQLFELTQELSWKVIKDYYESFGREDDIKIRGSKGAYRLAFNRGLITNLQVFMDMITSRNEASHTYNPEIADRISAAVIEKYYDAFAQLRTALQNELENSG